MNEGFWVNNGESRGELVLNGENNKYSGGTVVAGGGVVLPDTGTVKGITSRSSETEVKTYSLKSASPVDVANELSTLFRAPPAAAGDFKLPAVVAVAASPVFSEAVVATPTTSAFMLPSRSTWWPIHAFRRSS